VTEAAPESVIERYLQTLAEMADLAGEQGHTSSTRRWERLVAQQEADSVALRESEEGRATITGLLVDPRPTVRLLAATAALQWDEPTARVTLVELRESPQKYGLHSINAKHTLLDHDADT
jgi:hypothetical protein